MPEKIKNNLQVSWNGKLDPHWMRDNGIDGPIIAVEDMSPEFDLKKLAAKLHIRETRGIMFKKLERLAESAREIAKPRGAARMAHVAPFSADEVRLGGIHFKSPLLREKTESLGRVFAFITTEGKELAEWGESLDSAADNLLAREIRAAAIQACQNELENRILSRYGIKQVSVMCPGALPEWPIEAQIPLFHLLDPLPQNLGVTLLPSMLMSPDFSVSGIFFQTDKKFHNCQLCPRKNCPDRRVHQI